MKHLKLFLLFIAFFHSFVAFSGPGPKSKPKYASKNDEPSSSWVPIAGYNSTYGLFGGGGYFYNHKELSSHVFGIITQTAVIKLDLAYADKLSEHWYYTIKDDLGHGFEPIYGEGSLTRVEDRTDLILWRNMQNWKLSYWFDNHLSVGPTLDIRSHRSKQAPKGSLLNPPQREDAFGTGVIQELDYRDLPENATYGWYESATLLAVPAISENRNMFFGLLDLDLRFFQQMTKDIVLAIQIAGGTILGGNSTYLFQPRLGGTNRLRGYYDNRFRGNHYYLQQTELRFPIWKALSGVTFLEFGEATSEKFGAPQVSGGFGVRIGLPPDYISQIRIDIGFGKDQYGIFFDFGHSF